MTHRSTALLALIGLLSGCAHQVPAPAPTLPSPAVEADVPFEPPNLAEPAPPGEEGLVPPLAALSLREKVGQLVVPWIPGDYWADDNDAMAAALRLVTEDSVGGFVVGLGGSAYDLAAKFNALQTASHLPLFIAADLESGPSARIRGATAFPGNMGLGATGSEQDAYDVGAVIAREARAVGINLVFAPVVDVNNNPANPIINVRSYGEDPLRVGEYGVAFIRGLREHGMLATAKHFPGHGDAATDSHLALPVIAGTRSRLDSIELVPFRAAVAAGVDAVMSAHVAMPDLTGDVPATLSATVMDTVLRRDLGFRGLAVTDALNMGAIVNRYGPAQAAVRAIEAGADLLVMPVDPHQAVEAVVSAVRRGEVSEARLDSSVARILDAKRRAGLFRRRLVDPSAIARQVGTRRDQALAESIAQRALVLVKDSLALVPLGPERRRHVLVVTYADETNGTVGSAFAQALRAGGLERLSVLHLWPASGPLSYDSVRTQAREAGLVCVLVAARPLAFKPDAVNMPAALAALVQELTQGGAALITIAAGSPYLLGQVPSTPGYLIAWSDADVSERAAAEALLGMTGITGRLPVSLPPWAPRGAGLTRAGRPLPAGAGVGP